jgi:hypothetical protein
MQTMIAFPFFVLFRFPWVVAGDWDLAVDLADAVVVVWWPRESSRAWDVRPGSAAV